MKTINNTSRHYYAQKQEWRWPLFERAYFFVMLIYAAQMTPETSRMLFGLSGDPIPFLIPIVLTAILLLRNPVNMLEKKLWHTLGIAGVWSLASLIKYNETAMADFSYHFFFFYAILIAFIHVKVFGTDLLTLYEKEMVVICLVTLPLWASCVIFPNTARHFFSMFPETDFGYNFLYLFNYMDPDKGQDPRNAGFSWEPGRFAIMIVIALYCNLMRNGIKLRKNNNLWILLITMATTMSTTGYSVTLVLFLLFYIKKLTFSRIIFLLAFILPLSYSIFGLDFMGDKIDKQIENAAEVSSEDFFYINERNETGEYAFSLDRFPSMVFEWDNILEDPLLGYSRNREHSFFYKEVSPNVPLTGGLLKVLAQFGIFLAFLIYVALYKSSKKISMIFGNGSSMVFFFTILFCSVSYHIFCTPIFTAFWLYGIFSNTIKSQNKQKYNLEFNHIHSANTNVNN